jgi:hypothetical protein
LRDFVDFAVSREPFLLVKRQIVNCDILPDLVARKRRFLAASSAGSRKKRRNLGVGKTHFVSS